MRKLYTFLGTTDYREYTYTLPGDLGVSSPTRFAQIAILEMLERMGSTPDEIIVFLTAAARDKNWFSRIDSDGRTIPGLLDTLITAFGEDRFRIRIVEIDDDDTGDALWRLFEQMAEEAQANDEICIDITYSFRSTPVLSLIIGNYVSVLHGVKLTGLYYGKVPGKTPGKKSGLISEIQPGTGRQSCDAPVETPGRLSDGASPSPPAVIHDMTEMLNLFKWSQAIEAYLRTGNAQLLLNIVKELTTVSETDRAFMELAERLNRVSKAIETCRGRMVEPAINEARAQLNRLKADPSGRLKPFQKLLDQISRKLEGFRPGPYEDKLLFIVDWCIRHHLYQQGYTFLHEGMLTVLVRHAGLNPAIFGNRVRIKNVIYEALGKRDPGRPLPPDLMRLAESWKPFASELAFFADLAHYRNSINHGQATGPGYAPDELVDKLEHYRGSAVKMLGILHELPRMR